jgi:1-deoxy-D-xylulose-5-phosphate synthase
MALETAKLLEKDDVSAAVINARWTKPLDTALIEQFATRCEVLCTMEDHVLHNGFGCAVMEHLCEADIEVPVVRVGWPDEFIEHGSVPILRKKHGITAEAAAMRILKRLGRGPLQAESPVASMDAPTADISLPAVAGGNTSAPTPVA